MLPQSGQEGSSFIELSLNQRIRVEKTQGKGKAMGRVRERLAAGATRFGVLASRMLWRGRTVSI